MTKERFDDLLLYPHVSEKPTSAEVERMTVRYPYCQSLHILVAKMHGYTHHPNAEKSLHRAATYATDRTYLYHVMQNLHTPKTPDMPEQVVDLTGAFDEQILILEEPPVSEFEILVVPSVQHTTSSTLSLTETARPSVIETTSATEPLVISPISKPETPLEESSDLSTFSTEIFDISNPVESPETEVIIEPETVVEEEVIIPKETKSDVPPTDFIQWLSGLEAPEIQSFDHKVKKVRQVKKVKQAKQTPRITRTPTSNKVTADKGKRLKKLIEKSIVSNDSIASETLADLLVLQGKKKKAIKMYKQLSLKFPEKSAYFAAQIEKLKD